MVGLNSRGITSTLEDYFNTAVDSWLDEAGAQFEGIEVGLGELKQRLKRPNILEEEIGQTAVIGYSRF